jgi:hypothetical protein
MALTVEIDHARARVRKAAAAGTAKVVPQLVKGRIRWLKWGPAKSFDSNLACQFQD